MGVDEVLLARDAEFEEAGVVQIDVGLAPLYEEIVCAGGLNGARLDALDVTATAGSVPRHAVVQHPGGPFEFIGRHIRDRVRTRGGCHTLPHGGLQGSIEGTLRGDLSQWAAEQEETREYDQCDGAHEPPRHAPRHRRSRLRPYGKIVPSVLRRLFVPASSEIPKRVALPNVDLPLGPPSKITEVGYVPAGHKYSVYTCHTKARRPP